MVCYTIEGTQTLLPSTQTQIKDRAMTTLTNMTPSDITDWAVYQDETTNEYHVYLGTESFIRESFNELVADNPEDYTGSEEEFKEYCLENGKELAENCLDYLDVEYIWNNAQSKGEVDHDHYYVIQGK